MTKRSKEGTNLKEQFRVLATSEPVLPVLSDHPLAKDTAFDDRFELCYKLGPIFDIIRHKDTPTPTSIAIYGDWGTGKTSAMRWLEGLINEWNNNITDKNKTEIRTIWFYPWKYHNKDDVWRGLISEVIIKGTEIKGANIQRVTKAAKQFGLFLGKGFIHTLSALTLKAGDAKTTGEAEFDLACLKDVISEYDKNIHPEKAFLNEFENSFEQWLQETLSDKERMVIFIDDLDRCMPHVALRVLEALKLYLNVKKLIFVVGVDKNVINPLVKNHYEKLGLDKYKSDNYLAKMFQTEVTVGPSEKQIVEYLDYHLDNIEYFKKPYLEDWQVELFKELINNLADRNPREVKRLINSAVMSGAGAEMMKKATGHETNYTFAQGLQVFFIRRILESEKYNMPRLLGSEQGNDFFSEWSKIVQYNKEKEGFAVTLSKVTIARYLRDFHKKEININVSHNEELADFMTDTASQFYSTILNNLAYVNLLYLLSNEELGQLMKIPFSAEIAEITKEAEQSAAKQDDSTIIRQEVARRLSKNPEDIEENDYNSITVFDLLGKRISDITEISKMRNVVELYLRSNNIADISPLKRLTNIVELWLHDNQIIDISELSELKEIRTLSLHLNQISDISPLMNLTNMKVLLLSDNHIIDISPLANLTNVTELNLYNNQIRDITALKNLTKLERLSLSKNDIIDIAVLKDLVLIRQLYLAYNDIVDVEPLKDSNNLIFLNLNNTQVNDISPLQGLKQLTHLYISSTEISNIEPLKDLTNIRLLGITNTNVTDLKPLKDLVNLDALFISGLQIESLEQLKTLKKLRVLSFQNTDIFDLEPLSELTILQTIKMNNTPIKNIEPLKTLTNLKELYISGCKEITDQQIDDLKKALPNLHIER